MTPKATLAAPDEPATNAGVSPYHSVGEKVELKSDAGGEPALTTRNHVVLTKRFSA